MSGDEETRPENEEGDESGVYMLDIDDEEGADVEALTREAMEAVEKTKHVGGEAKVSGDVEDMESVDTIDRENVDQAVATLEQELAELRDRSVRTLADFENFRRRAERERDDLKRYALFDALYDFLPVVDNLERALAAGGNVEDLKTGVEMILRQFKDLLRQRGVQEVKAAGQPFDPAHHEAVARDEDPSVTEPMVTEELQRGYILHGRLLRPAMVRVAMPAADERSSSEKGGEEA